MDRVEHLGTPFPWRTAAVAAGAVALAELVALLALAGVDVAPSLHRHGHATAAATVAARAATTPAATARAVVPATKAPRWSRRAIAHSLRPRSAVSVLVLNGNGITGAAGREAARLLARGYRSTSSADAANHDYARSLVLFAPGYEREGKRLGRDAGIRAVSALDGVRTRQLRGSQLVVILGDR